MARHDHFGWVGQIIDAKYRVVRAVDEGTFGVVYQAHHLKFDEKVALKCLKLPVGLRGAALEEFCQRFIAEGRFLHRLSRANPNIVQALDVGAELGVGGVWVPYLVLEWLDGISLADDLEQRKKRGAGGRGLGAAMALLEPAALALATAHEQRVAHRDVKPANLFLTAVAGHLTLKVLDFGIAQIADVAEEHSTEALGEAENEAFCAFSPFYAAPEQFDRSYGPTGPKTDVFSLALVLVEVASGRPALEGNDIAELFRASSDPYQRPTLRARGVDCPDAVDAVVRRALSPRPADRYETALDLWQALEQAVGRSVPRLDAASWRAFPALAKGAGGAGASKGIESAKRNEGRAGHESAANDDGEEIRAGATASGRFRLDAEGTAATTGEHSASDETSANRAKAARARRTGTRLGKVAAMTSGAVLALAAMHQGVMPDLHAASATDGAPPLASRLDASAAAGLGSRLFARFDATPPALSPPASGAPAAAETPRPASHAPANPEATPRAEGAGDFTVRALGRAASLDYLAASRECAKEGMALCTETQWQLACQSSSPLTASESWTATPEPGEGAAVRGGSAGCGARRVRPASQALPAQGQICCAPALIGAR
ncbi:MAG: serine/threonine protein kinase [Polyangiaceae bacterium]|nr:serine/threonine protein kinase [Polyangiaceae bacterium]